ncbi:acyl-CoA dehydrogenase family protein [Actinomadura rudentiformis]|uniref:Acyl-CoA dehydrogenase n=1 Tax=Actinomadura rudentiformis TaxID=359158 RepID=A0A6H9YI84_9ACTN|nr:acyl-CoA dehydrogenase family protein [Actinomadura rudentiformis]KAB2340393.1 acyl-CoA dehydrogenase [Actinomadura rudentiformis]
MTASTAQTGTAQTGASTLDDEELEALRDTVREVCADAGGTTSVRELDENGRGYDERLWRVLAQEVGLAGLGLPGPYGDGGLAELAVVCEELGRVLAPVPFLGSTVLAGQVLARCGPLSTTALKALAEGQVHALAVADADGAWRPENLAVTAQPAGDGWRLTGMSPFVLDGTAAAGFVVAAAGPDGVDVFTVAAGAPGVTARPTECLDLSRSQAMLLLDDAPAVRVTVGGTGATAVTEGLDLALVALSAEQLGGAQACLDMTVAYARERTQFGRAIGSFQAVKHRCADMLLQVETARSAVLRAVAVQDDPSALAEAAAVAQSWCCEAYAWVAEETVQLHGGIGFTWEHDAHLYFRRAVADAALLGGSAHHRERLARLLGW